MIAAGRGHQDAGVVPVLKHFPGHGSLTTDSHLGLPVQKRTRAELDRIDLRPFREAIAADAPAVMIGHIDVRAVDPGRPASVSRKVITGLLRRDLGFRGVVVTDSLAMDGVEKQYPGGRGAVAALRAGADVLLMPPDPAVARTAIVTAVRAGRLPRARLEAAATRMLAMLIHRNAGAAAPRRPRLAAALLLPALARRAHRRGRTLLGPAGRLRDPRGRAAGRRPPGCGTPPAAPGSGSAAAPRSCWSRAVATRSAARSSSRWTRRTSCVAAPRA